MLDVVCIFLLYAVQGAVQGVVFGALPLLLRQNPTATDIHQSQFSAVGYPFSLKFLLAPLIDGVYWKRVGRRESWLLPLQVACAAWLLRLGRRVGPMLDASPPDVGRLSAEVFALVAVVAAADIATDAWAAGRMSDSRASVCQSLGLTVGFEAASTGFFFLKGRGLVDIGQLLVAIGVVGLALLALFLLQMCLASPKPDGEEEDVAVGIGEVLQRVRCVGRAPNMRWWVLFLVLWPVLGGHRSVLAVRYQELGFSPEVLSEYDLYLLPLSLVVLSIAGRVAQAPRLLTCLSWAGVAQALLYVAQQAHFHRCRQAGPVAAQDAALRAMYVCLSQLTNALDTVCFVIKVAVYNRVAQQHEAIAGTVITVLASLSNLGGTWPATLAPLAAHAVGLDALVASCLGAGVLVLGAFWRRLRRLEDPGDVGWLAPSLAGPHED